MKHKFNENQIRRDIATLCDCNWINPEDIIYLLKELNHICGRIEQLNVKLRIEIEGKRIPTEKWVVKE